MLLFFSGCAAAPAARLPPAGPTTWNFSDPAAPLAASSGPARLKWRGLGEPRIVDASAEGLAPPPGGRKTVLALPAAGKEQGLELTHASPPNGVFRRDGLVSNYTLIFDALWPQGGPDYRALLQTDPANADDADLFAKVGTMERGLSLGLGNAYFGAMGIGTWRRIAVAVQSALGSGGTGQLQLFVDGAFLGSRITDGPEKRCRWSLLKSLLLFADNDGETAPVYLSGLLFTDRLLPMGEIRALGGVSGEPGRPGPPPPPETRRLPRRLQIYGHRGASCCAPENTLASIHLAFQTGADAAEVDIRMTSDRVAVLMHDERVDRTTDGAGHVSQMRLSKIKSLDAGSWFDPAYAGERVPTLAEALAAAKGRGPLMLDTKLAGMGRAIAKAMRQAGVGPEAIRIYRGVEAKSYADILKHVRGAEILYGGVPAGDEEFLRLKAEGVTGFDLDLSLVTPELTAGARKHGMSVTAYTALDPESMLRAGEAGATGIETDFPAVLKGLQP